MPLGEFLGDYPYLVTAYNSNNWPRPYIKELLFLSTTETTEILTETYVADRWDGYFNTAELDKLGDDTALTTGLEDLTTLPYPSRLRPVRDISFLKDASHVMIVGCEFTAFDVKNDNAVTGDQTTSLNTTLKTSIGTQNNIEVQTTLMRSIPVDWIPNYFSPAIKVNGKNLLPEFEATHAFSSTSTKKNRADLSMGTRLPYERKIYSDFFESGIDDLRIYAFCANYVPDGATNRVRRFPLYCRLIIAHN